MEDSVKSLEVAYNRSNEVDTQDEVDKAIYEIERLISMMRSGMNNDG